MTINIPRRRWSTRGALGLMTLAISLTGTTCSSDPSYTYVDVHVTTTLDPTQLYLITSCEVQVLGADSGNTFGLPCIEKKVSADVGTFQWSSTAKSGTLQFLVRLLDGNHVIMGESTSDPVKVSPGNHLQTSVVVTGVAPPASADADGGTDSDANVLTDASSAEVSADTSNPGDDAGTSD